jgi:hypothetical protein
VPNGRSGGFVIETSDLRQLVAAVAADTEVGLLATHLLRPRAASATEIAPYIQECPHDRVAVEEQDNKFYIIHLSNDPDIVWVVVHSASPIHAELRLRHAKWMSEHPGWPGWIAF